MENMVTAKASRPATCEALLDAGTELILEKGYNHCGLDEILKRAEAKKGSFYHFFSSKEEFGLAVVDRYAAARFATLDRFLGDDSRRPLERLRLFFEDSARRHESMGYRRGCLFGNLGQEMADQSEAFRRRLSDCLRHLHDQIAGCLRLAQEQGDLSPALDADRLADYCLNSWEGAVLRMKVVKSIEPLEEFLEVMFGIVLK
jgi:TetR/AcrR family transcriptional repressor of nem operon